MPILSAEDHRFFTENGYVVVPNAVPQKNLDAVIAAIWEFTGLDPNDPNDWYRPPLATNGMIEMYQHQALWDNRQHPRLYQAFADILGTEKLWASMDRASMKPPMDPRFPHYEDRGFVHWDLDTAQPLPTRLGVQGVLALADTDENMGGFCCIPGFHRNLAEWIAQQPTDRNPRAPDLSRLPPGFKVTPIPMKAGDLVIWNRMLAHGNGRNEGTRPRLAQYISMHPARDDEEMRQDRIACWRDKHAPSYWEKDIPEALRGRERGDPPAELTPLGRKLLGLDLW